MLNNAVAKIFESETLSLWPVHLNRIMTLLPDPNLEDTPEKIQFVQVANEQIMETTEKSRKHKLRRTWSLSQMDCTNLYTEFLDFIIIKCMLTKTILHMVHLLYF